MADEQLRPQDNIPSPPPEESKEQPPQPPKHYATRGQRVAAWIAAIGVIIITLAYVYALSTGALFKA